MMVVMPSISDVLESCPKCGSGPILSRRIFKMDSGEKRVHSRGKIVKRIAWVPMAYLHCECGHCTTDWAKAETDIHGRWLKGSEIKKAERAWRDREWVSIEEDEKED